MNINDLHDYQKRAARFIIKERRCALFLDMGLGKTVSTLTAASKMLERGKIRKVLVLAPLRVANNVWKQEAEKWEHLQHLRVQVCTGTAKQRIKAFNKDADIYVLNHENVKWLVDLCWEKGSKWPFDMIVIDESSAYKSHKAQRFIALSRVVNSIRSIVLLTGTPSHNGLHELWPQFYLIDAGKRLGKNMTAFWNQFGFFNEEQGEYWLTPEGREEVQQRIVDKALVMEAEDYLSLPEKITTRIVVDTTPLEEDLNEQVRDGLVLIDDAIIDIPWDKTKAQKLQQVAHGAIYDEDHKAHFFHTGKTDALKEIVDGNPNENILVVYQFQFDVSAIRAVFPGAEVPGADGSTFQRWNLGEVPMMLLHPKSAGHGLNLQDGGNIIVWYGLPWSAEQYEQMNARLHRQGQTKPVTVIHIVGSEIEDAIERALARRIGNQEAMLTYIKQQGALKK